MTLYVRLQSGVEDSHPAYEGCLTCTYPGSSTSYGGGKDYSKDECPGCGTWSGGYDTRHVLLGWFNPAASDVDGTLVVKRYKTQIGYYPAGTWISWRAD